VILCDGEILPQHLPLASAAVRKDERSEPAALAEVEKRHVLRVLEQCGGNRTAAAKLLDIGRNTLSRKLKEYGVPEE
jgi:Nif-specific regulatory protein